MSIAYVDGLVSYMQMLCLFKVILIWKRKVHVDTMYVIRMLKRWPGYILIFSHIAIIWDYSQYYDMST